MQICKWSDISQERWENLLLGNGFSQNIEQAFSYRNLYEFAKKNIYNFPQDLFSALGTENFEEVLKRIVNDPSHKENYEIVKNALLNSIHKLHPHKNENWLHLDRVAENFHGYKNIFTTNYDLLLYWITVGQKNFKDYFWNRELVFNKNDTISHSNSCLIHYLHGALHIKDINGKAVKIKASINNKILGEISSSLNQGNIPLFISEGSSKAKEDKISSSDYLTFCLHKLGTIQNNLLILGHSLSEYDGHVVQRIANIYNYSLNNNRDFKIAISLYGDYERELNKMNQNLSRYITDFRNIRFFKSEEHPITMWLGKILFGDYMGKS